MAFDAHSNFSYSTVATAPSPATTGTSLVVAAGEGARFPAAPFNAVIWPTGVQPLSTNAEIVRVTARATDTLTITRTQEGTSARTVVVGDQIAANITNKTLTDIEAIDTTTVHLAGAETITGLKTVSLAGSAVALAGRRTGDTFDRTQVYNDGEIWFGAGTVTDTDTGILRTTVAYPNAVLEWWTASSRRGGVKANGDPFKVRGSADVVIGQDGLASLTAATAAIANTETVVLSATLPANLMAAGTTFRIVATGVGTATTATAGSTWRVRIGTTTLTGNIAASLTGTSAIGTAIPFVVTALVTVRTAGASGTIIGSLVYNSNAATGNLNTTIAVGQVTTAVAVDTTAQKLLELTYISGVSTTTSTYHNAVIEMVKA